MIPTDFLFDEFFMHNSVYTIGFCMPSDHDSLLVDLRQLSCSFSSVFLIQRDTDVFTCVTFVSKYSLPEFHKRLFSAVNQIRSRHKLTYKMFNYN